MPTQVLVPPLGQTVDTMSFVAWLKREGEFVQQGEPLYVIETDKAMLDVEAPATGVLAAVVAQKGDEVKALAPIAVILTELADHQAALADGVEHEIAKADENVNHERRESRAPASVGKGRRFVSPRARWLAEAEGVPVEEVDATGPEGAVVERDVQAFLKEREAARSVAAKVAESAGQEPRRETAGASPLARRLAEEAGVDLASVRGTGPRGQITREDVEAAAARRTAEPAEKGLSDAGSQQRLSGAARRERFAEPIEVIPFAGVRKVIAERMSASSQETAPVTLTAEADATELARLRERLDADGVAVSYNDLMIYALARALRRHPRMNASLDEEGVKVWAQVHIGLAVDAERGLLVPVVRDADRMGLGELAAATAALAERARGGRCGPDELQGGTFTLTNLGMFGIDAFTPIINLPECAILGMGRIKTEPVWIGDHVEPRQRVWLSLTFDHRLVDGGPAARFLQTVVRLVEKPHLLMA